MGTMQAGMAGTTGGSPHVSLMLEETLRSMRRAFDREHAPQSLAVKPIEVRPMLDLAPSSQGGHSHRHSHSHSAAMAAILRMGADDKVLTLLRQ